MSKVSVIEIDNIHSPGTSSSLNTNFTRIQSAIENTLSRDGTPPNWMNANLDMNGYNIINVGEISNSDTPVSSGGGSAGGSFGLTFDGSTDQTAEVNSLFETYSYVKILTPTDATGALRIDGSIDVPDGCVLDVSDINIDLGTYGRIYAQGKISELPGDGTSNIRLAQAAEAGDTVIYINLVEASNADLVAAGELFIIRGENDSAGVAIFKEEKRIASVSVTGSLTRTVTLETALENDYELEYPDSAHTPEGGGPDRTLLTVAVGSLLSGNVAMYDRVISVADGSLFTAGDTVLLRSEALVTPGDSTSIPYGEEPNVVESVNTNDVTLARPIGRPFLTADGAGLYKLESRRVTVIGGNGLIRAVQAGPADRRIDFVGGQYLYNSYFKNIRINSLGQTYDKEGAGVVVRRSINTIIENPKISNRVNTGSGDGNGVFVAYSIGTIVINPVVERCRHGVILQGGVYNVVYNGNSIGCYTNGFDFHGAGETASGFIDCTSVGSSTLSPDSTTTGGMTVGNTRWRGTVTDCFVDGYHASGFETTDYFGITVRAPIDGLLLRNLKFLECDKAIRLAIDDRAGAISIDKVTIDGVDYIDCGTDFDATDVEAPAWGASETIDTATTIRPRYRVNDSKLYKTEAGGTTGSTAPTHSSGTQSDDNLDWTYVAAQAIRITNTIDRTKASGMFYDNTASGLDAENVQEAIDELQSDIDGVVSGLVTPDDMASTGTPSVGSILTYASGSSFDWASGIVASTGHTTTTVDTSTTLTAASHSRLFVSGTSLNTRLIVARNSSDQSAAVALTLEENCSQSIMVRVAEDQTGTVTITRSGTNTFNGSDTSIVMGGAGSTILIEPSRTSGDFSVEGEYVALRTIIGGIASPVLSDSGTLTMEEHCGRIVLLTGAATVPVTDGFNATLVASGASRDVDAGGTAVSVADGDSITVWSDGTTVWYTPAITISTMATS